MSRLESKLKAISAVGVALHLATSVEAQSLPIVVFETDLGRIVIELDQERAPRTVGNFLSHVNGRFFDGLIFHRVISEYIVQTGVWTEDYQERLSGAPFLELESTGLLNVRGTVSMARASDPHTAQAEFFFNVSDNNRLNPSESEHGYAVFGRVLEGMDVVDQINAGATWEYAGRQHVPLDPVRVETAYLAADDPPHWTVRTYEEVDPLVCENPGVSYIQGEETLPAPSRDVFLFERACGCGEARGCYELGLSFDTGKGVERDGSRAIILYRGKCLLRRWIQILQWRRDTSRSTPCRFAVRGCL